jgi:hypothetical protein
MKNPKRVKAGKVAAATRRKTQETIAALDGQFCAWVLWVALGAEGTGVRCDKPAPFEIHPQIAGFLCGYHAALSPRDTTAERKRDDKRFADCKTRAEALAIRDAEREKAA